MILKALAITDVERYYERTGSEIPAADEVRL